MNSNKYLILIVFCLFLVLKAFAQQSGNNSIINNKDFEFLETLTKDVLESSRIYSGQEVPLGFGVNNTGGTLIRPGGRDCYPAFWIRDYAMSLDCGFITVEEQKHMLLLTASTQCDQTWISRGGSMIPTGAIADHIRMDNSLPIYFPGTYSYEDQGTATWGKTPPYGDQFLFVHMAYIYLKTTDDINLLTTKINGTSLIDRLELAFKVPPVNTDNQIVYTTDEFRGVDFGFRDAITITGDLCFPSILKYRASNELAELFEMLGDTLKADKYKNIAKNIRAAIPQLFMDENGMLLASTGKSSQPDVWSTALAIYYNILDDNQSLKSCRYLADAYLKGELAYKGNIRHILTCDDASESSAWKYTSTNLKKDTYQNGAYWGTPVGWVCFAIARADVQLAKKLAGEYINELRENDYRKGKKFGAPYECFNKTGENQNPVYLTSVTCPFAVLKDITYLNNKK